MKIPRPRKSVPHDRERGSAALIVLILLVIISSIAIGNNVALSRLQRELRLIEFRQLQRYGPTAVTNQSARATLSSPPPGPIPGKR